MAERWQKIADKFRAGDKLYLIITINAIVFLVMLLFPVVGDWLFLPSYLPTLATHFWTPLTCLFVNYGVLNTLFSLLWLYWMGLMFEEYLSNKRILGVYLLGGLTGGAIFVLSCNIIPNGTGSDLGGAPLSLLTMMVALGTLVPNLELTFFMWPIKFKWLAIFYAAIDVYEIAEMGPGVIIAHAGAALIGFLYIKQLQKGNDWLERMGNLFTSRRKLTVAAKNPLKRGSFRPRQEEVDLILDKISQRGYESLSKEEKEILFRASKNES